MSKDTLVTVIVSPDRAVHTQLESALAAGSITETVWAVSDYPDLPALERLNAAPQGCVLFLDFSDGVRARRIASELDRAYPFVSVVAIQRVQTKDEVIALMQLGVREVIGNPISAQEVALAFVRAAKKLRPADDPGGHVYAFVPAKPGAGATTIAISTASAVARISGQRTLLLDFDLRLGVTSFLLKLDGRHSVQDALNAGAQLDVDFWDKLVCRRGSLDVLGSAPVELPSAPRPDQYTAVLNLGQSLYPVVCVDLPGTAEGHELDTMERAKGIFMVCTPDVTGLHMAKRKAESLLNLRLGEKVSVIFNHADKRLALRVGDIEKLLQLPVRFILPSDPKSVEFAVREGTAIQGRSLLASRVEALARSMMGAPLVRPPSAPVRRFIEFFSVSQVRDREIWKR